MSVTSSLIYVYISGFFEDQPFIPDEKVFQPLFDSKEIGSITAICDYVYVFYKNTEPALTKARNTCKPVVDSKGDLKKIPNVATTDSYTIRHWITPKEAKGDLFEVKELLAFAQNSAAKT